MAKEKVVKEVAETPLMKQYNQIKAKHPQAMLLFRVGDFYETLAPVCIGKDPERKCGFISSDLVK